jgi:hypothetical protein
MSSCPYCNAILIDVRTDGRRITCPTCGESFTPLGEEGGELAVKAPENVAAPVRPAATLPIPQQPRTRLIAGGVLGVMAVMAAAGLILALMTRDRRRANDRGIVRDRSRATPFLVGQSGDMPPPQPRSPASLEALRYLPTRTNLILGVHVAELGADPSGKQLLNQPMQLGPARIGLNELARWTGVPVENVDHLVLGLDTGSGTIPRINLVVRTRRPYDRRANHDKLDAEKVSDVPAAEPRTFYQTRFEAIRLPAALWCADDRTLVFGLTVIDLDDVPPSPQPSLDHLPVSLTEVLE